MQNNTNYIYFKNLIQTILCNSEAPDWESAVTEWKVTSVEEDMKANTDCICGHHGIRYLFAIQNQINGNQLSPIGSECVKKFNVSELKNSVTANKQLFKLLHAVDENKFISLDGKLFSRRLLEYLFELGAFKASAYNSFNPEDDYHFMLNMFNQRNQPTEKQQRKINALIMSSIIPYLKNRLKILRTDDLE